MRVITNGAYGSFDGLRSEDIPVPSPGKDEVLIRVMAAAVNPGDVFSVLGRPYVMRLTGRLFSPRRPVPGRAFAGVVESVGANAYQFQPGDEVCAEISAGAYAEYVAVPEKALARKPDNLTFEQASAVPLSAVTALQGLRDRGRVQPGDRVLINGASGGIGTFAVQIAKAFGAEVTAVCSTRNVELVRSIGADHVIDYTSEDFTAGETKYDVVFDLVGSRSLADCRRALVPDGTLILASGPPEPVIRRMIAALVQGPFVSQRFALLAQAVRAEDLDVLTEMVEAGSVTPVIDRVYPLAETASALLHQADGHAQGRTVIAVG